MPNLSIKEVVKQLTSPTWATHEQLRAFVEDASPMDPRDVEKALAAVLDRGPSGDARSNALRCSALVGIVEASLSPELFAPLVRALRVADPSLRASIVSLLPKVNDVASHALLVQVLAESSSDVRRAAATVLAQVGGKTAFDLVLGLAQQPAFPGRIEALDAFAARAGSLLVPLVEAVLIHGNSAEQAHALGFLADPRTMSKSAAEALEMARGMLDRAADERVLGDVISVLTRLASEEQFFDLMGVRLTDPNPKLARAVVHALRAYRSKRTADYLLERFRHGPNVVRHAVIETAEALGSEESLAILVEALQFRHVVIRTRAADVLGRLGRDKVVDPARCIIWLLRSRDVNVRRTAIEVARQVGDDGGGLATSLLKYLRDEDWWVRERTVDALIETMGSGLTRHVAEFLADPSDVVRRWAIGSLRRLKDTRAAGALVRVASHDPDWWVREQAVEALGELGDKRVIPHLVELLRRQPDARVVCVEALQKLEAREAGPVIADLLADAEADVRLVALRCLEAFDDPTHIASVRLAHGDSDARVRGLATALLARWNMPLLGSQADDKTRSVLDKMLAAVARAEADDLVLSGGRRPYVKRMGKMVTLSDTVLTDEQVRSILLPHLTSIQLAELERLRDVDFSYDVKSHGLRFRVNVFQQMSGIGAVFRIVKNKIPNLADLGLPEVARSFANFKNGLVLVGGPTGSGKSTTLAALIDYINEHHAEHVITIEDPIEIIHATRKCLVNQREIGTHTASFQAALRRTLRQDPDVILIGEMRDLDTISFAVTAAETGHLVFGTLHTASADTSVDRLIDAFPPGQQPQVRSMLSESLRAVLCQHLVRKKGGEGRVLAAEVMINNEAISNLIRKSKTFQIPQVIATSRDLGMQSMDSDLARLVKAGVVDADEAFMKAADKKAFEALIQTSSPKDARSAQAAGY